MGGLIKSWKRKLKDGFVVIVMAPMVHMLALMPDIPVPGNSMSSVSIGTKDMGTTHTYL